MTPFSMLQNAFELAFFFWILVNDIPLLDILMRKSLNSFSEIL